MWKFIKIEATNLCAFKEINYALNQQCTTLIFGNNMDDDSQASNGSGKSALLEAIAISITGEPLRKAKVDEIINDAADNAQLNALLYNDSTNKYLEINRLLSRKSPQQIQIYEYVNEEEKESIVQAGVADYNKYVLDAIGLTKDELFANFILTEDKFQSFLSASDKDKKEIINRFSNGIIVDESIAALQQDMQPIEEELQLAESNVANCNGRVEALQEQLNTALTESVERSQKKAQRVAEWKENIANKRAYIREQQRIIDNANTRLDQYEIIDALRTELESSNKNVDDCYKEIQSQFEKCEIVFQTDYVARSKQLADQLKEITHQSTELAKEEKQIQAKYESSNKEYSKVIKKSNKFNEEYSGKSVKITEQINKLIGLVKELDTENSKLKTQREQLECNISTLQTQLAGVIICPNCKHEFMLQDNADIQELRQKLRDCQGEVNDIAKTIEKNTEESSTYIAKGREVRQKQYDLEDSKSQWAKRVSDANVLLQNSKRAIDNIVYRQNTLKHEVEKISTQLNNVRTEMFDDIYNVLGDAFDAQEQIIKQANLNIDNANGAIQSYEESIKDIETASETDIIESLKVSKSKYEKELNAAISKKESVEQRLNEYKMQEATFIEFKTHLANTKIDALSHITNEFLEAIHSNIRIAFSGFTVLKSGKVRDKISISLIRDGVDCGSFGKFSKGERARVNLANILAMHKLTNINCDENKGLDLLILDEILDGTDEQGLTNIFEALNQLQITALVVTHTNIAENYPYKTVVNKLNGVSYINGDIQ